ncbi:winged helix DNA-binding domain-containing protein [Gemmatirosa kalamazoonensis]|nr:winged helix DNA-binding domain-containing protein [Gemmatirosa kalamazoonensis]
MTTLTVRDLNRATLARQMLLARERHAVPAAVERLGGLQAQLARPPFVALWVRLDGFTRDALLDAVRARAVVRATMMRATLHLVSADDFARLRPALQPMLTAAMRGVLRDRFMAENLGAVTAAARPLLAAEPRTFEVLRAELSRAFPEIDERALGYAVRMHLPLVQVPNDRSAWGWETGPAFALADDWLGTPVPSEPAPDAMRALVRRYLGAFGPATPADAGAWCGLRGLKATFDAMRDELAMFRDARGRELFDLPEAPRPGEDVDAPPRLLPEFDTLVLAHDDRSRVIADAHRARVVSKNLQVAATFLVDGVVAGTWKAARVRGEAVLTATPFASVSARVRRALEPEGDALLRFVEPDAKGYAVRFAAA